MYEKTHKRTFYVFNTHVTVLLNYLLVTSGHAAGLQNGIQQNETKTFFLCTKFQTFYSSDIVQHWTFDPFDG